jgi:osmotically-inducible protein OsmY
MNTNTKLKEALTAQLDYWVGACTRNVDVTVADGIVTLRGHVPTNADKMECEETVRRVGGVKGVVDDVVVTPFEPEDAEMVACG